MAQSANSSTIFDAVFPFADFLYILQQEEYSSRRFLKWLPWFWLRRGIQQREHLKYTVRVKVTLAVAVGIWLSVLAGIFLVTGFSVWLLVGLCVWIIHVPMVTLVANVLVSPVFAYFKSRQRRQAAAMIAKTHNLKVVAVAGSYGKTTVKNFIHQFVRYNYRTQMIPGNINTPTGIAGWILHNLESATELLIMEVDAYAIGEIALSCDMAPADIAILTNVGDQHLERFGSQSRLGQALVEVFGHAKPEAQLITDEDTLTKLSFQPGSRTVNVVPRQTIEFHDVVLNAPELSDSNQSNLRFALRAAELLGIPRHFIEDGLSKLELPDRRQRHTEMYGYEALDDSYNISYTTAQAGLKAARRLADKAGKKLLVVTAGIPELSVENTDKNRELGKLIAANADQAIILASQFATDVAAGAGSEKSTIYADIPSLMIDAHRLFPPEAWFLLMQPELSDLYY